MSQVDVRDLAREGLPPGQFPADLHSDFRVHMTPEVLRGIESHAKADHTVEICGVLVGGWEKDEQGPFAAVTDYIRCDNAASKFAEVTFTHESWAQINKEMDSKHDGKRIVGWYHSHPDFGIFLSDRDCFIQQHFFSGAGQVAYVIDPVRDLEGVFVWRKGKPTPLPVFWAGDEIRMSQPAEDHPRHEGRAGGAAAGAMGAAAAAAPVYAERQPTPLVFTLLGWLGLFLLGYFYAGMLSRAEEYKRTEGAVATFMNDKVLRWGLDRELDLVRLELQNVAAAVAQLTPPGEKLSKVKLDSETKTRALVADKLKFLDVALATIRDRYAMSPDEQAIHERLYAEERALLKVVKQPSDAKLAKPPKPSAGGTTMGPPASGSSTPGAPAAGAPATGGSTANPPAASTPRTTPAKRADD